MTALDPFEKMNSEAFELIGTDAPVEAVAGNIEISIDEGGVEFAHRQGGDGNVVGLDCSAAHEAESGMQMMGAPRQLFELRRSLYFVGWFRVEPVPESQDLVGAAD